MFEPQTKPRVFAMAPGQDFPRDLVAGLRRRMADQPPHAMARVTLYVNTQRMMRRIEKAFHEGPSGFLPQLRMVTDAGRGILSEEQETRSPLARQLELSRYVTALIKAQPDLAPPSAAFELAGSLAQLRDETLFEGIPFDTLLNLDVTDASGHWQRSLQFLRIVHELDQGGPMDMALAGRLRTERLIRHWQETPPEGPVLIVGSTGSRGVTNLLMQAAARLDQGAVVLPGFDRDLPDWIWSRLIEGSPEEDHPQARFAALMNALALRPDDVAPWLAGADAPDPDRNRLISMALRPAPVTDGWMEDGPGLGDLPPATENLSLLEAADPGAEAVACALILRDAAERGERVALVSPDRMLTRRVAAALDRWRIEPDDSAGEPLGQTALGRLLRQLVGLAGERLSAESLVILLKSPRVCDSDLRGPHLLYTRALEVSLRRYGPAFPTVTDLTDWAARRDDPKIQAWVAWLAQVLEGLTDDSPRPLAVWLTELEARLDLLVRGPGAPSEAQVVLDGKDGVEVRKCLTALAEAAEAGGEMDAILWRSVLRGVLSGEVRDPNLPHPEVMFWGPQESRVQGADLVILAGLNDGVWPKQPDPDPWLNRAMRQQAGLTPPERRIGLSAHDFQQAAGAPRVVLSHAKRSSDAEAVPSRWLNRLCNLLAGLKDQSGPEALEAMRARGDRWLALAAALDVPETSVPPEPRPSPAPPAGARPRKLSVTDVEKLLRDPFQIYARHVLRLKPLDPLRHRPDPALRGSVLHLVLETALPGFAGLDQADQKAHLLKVAAEVLAEQVPWPTARQFWLARLTRVADHFLSEEAMRAARGTLLDVEEGASLMLPGSGMTLTAKTDRIDLTQEGAVWIYDYKTGKPPTKNEQRAFNKQLHITAFLAEAGGFSKLGPMPVAGAEYIGLGSDPKTVPADFQAVPLDGVQAGLNDLFLHFLDPATGFAAQVARQSLRDFTPYDHLSRGGEWDMTEVPEVIRVGDHDDADE